jgi:hypothetical protein
MRRSREVSAGAVVILALLACFFFLRPGPQRRANQAPGQAGFITTPENGPRAPSASGQEPRRKSRGTTESAQLPLSSNANLRRGADERFPAQLDLLVLDSTTRLPIAGATVKAMNRATRETVAEQVLPEGRGTMDLPTGPLYLSFDHPDYQERGLWIELNSTVGLVSRQTIELRREVEVSGTVRDQNGAPVSEAEILLFGGDPRHRRPQILTGADGKFNCRVLVGSINGTVIKGENRTTFASQATLSRPNVLDITLPITSATISFTGRVLNQKGEPVEGALVRVLRPGRRGSGYSQKTEEDGTFAFTFPPFLTDGIVTISAPGVTDRAERVPLTADVQRDFVIDSQPAFTVTLLTPEGEALTKGFRVESIGPSAPRITRLRDGRFCAAAYPVEIRAVAVDSGYGNSDVARLSAYEPEVTLRIEPGGNLSGRAVDLSGRSITRFSYLLLQGHNLYLSQSLIDSPDGSFAVRHVAPGAYTLNIVADGYRMQGREIEIEAGHDYFVEMILQPEAGRQGARTPHPHRSVRPNR